MIPPQDVAATETLAFLADEVFGDGEVRNSTITFLRFLRSRIYFAVDPDEVDSLHIVGRVPLRSVEEPLTVETTRAALLAGERIEVGCNGDVVTPSEESASFEIAYALQDGGEVLTVAGHDFALPQIHPHASSLFAKTWTLDIREAFERYIQQVARTSNCETLGSAWVAGRTGPRWFAIAGGAERPMQRSLRAWLLGALRSASSIEPEHPTDESNPVDILVRYPEQRVGIVEVKWLGASLDTAPPRHFTAQYGEPQANSGAAQLADYLVRYHDLYPDQHVRGYLFVFDLRRRGLQPETTTLALDDAFAFQNAEVTYSPDYKQSHGHLGYRGEWRGFVEPRLAFVHKRKNRGS